MKHHILAKYLFCIAVLITSYATAYSADATVELNAPGIDGRFVQLAVEVPGFGGYFFDVNGDLNVYLTDLVREPQARQVLGDTARNRPAGPWDRPAAILVRRGDFDILQLQEWRQRFTRAGLTKGVHVVDNDEVINRLFVGVTEPEAIDGVLAQLDELDIPRPAVVVDVVKEGSLITSVRDFVRPIVGGLQIHYNNGVPRDCTLGVNVLYGNILNGVPLATPGFFTASHCSGTYLGTDQTTYYQGGVQIGVERWDPPFFTDAQQELCPPYRRCRWSDVTFVAYDAGVDRKQGFIAQTFYRGFGPFVTGSLEINPTAPEFGLTQTVSPAIGLYLDKIGGFSGWTSGSVVATCRDYHTGDVSILCQDEVDAYGDGGDSGSPVFQMTGPSTAALAGIVWYKTTDGRFVFSNLTQIARDMGYSITYE